MVQLAEVEVLLYNLSRVKMRSVVTDLSKFTERNSQELSKITDLTEIIEVIRLGNVAEILL